MKSMPGTMFCVQNATCSVSAKKLSTTRSSTSRPTRRTGTSSSGMILVASSTSNANLSANSSSNSCSPSSHSGKSPGWIASHRSRRWKSGSAPLIFTASFHTTDCMPSFGFQWNLTKVDLPSRVDQPEGVDAEAFHEAERARDRPVGHDPHHHVHALRDSAR